MSILVALDNDLDARLAAYLVRGLDGEVAVVSTLAEAECRVREHTWSVLILDTALPDGSGLTFLARLARLNYAGAVLLLSATADLAVRVRALEDGADAYLPRPYEPAELIAQVKALLRRARRRAIRDDGNVVRAGEMELDVQAMEVALPGNRRERLTPNEMRVLHYLMTHPGRVVDYQELAARVFSAEDSAASANAIGVYVRRVRQKIEAGSCPRYITTVRGSGYRFNA